MTTEHTNKSSTVVFDQISMIQIFYRSLCCLITIAVCQAIGINRDLGQTLHAYIALWTQLSTNNKEIVFLYKQSAKTIKGWHRTIIDCTRVL